MLPSNPPHPSKQHELAVFWAKVYHDLQKAAKIAEAPVEAGTALVAVIDPALAPVVSLAKAVESAVFAAFGVQMAAVQSTPAAATSGATITISPQMAADLLKLAADTAAQQQASAGKSKP